MSFDVFVDENSHVIQIFVSLLCLTNLLMNFLRPVTNKDKLFDK